MSAMSANPARSPLAAPLATILSAAGLVSAAGCLLAFFGRLARLDGDFDAAVQYAIGGLLVGPLLVFLLFGFLLAREGLWLIEALTQHDITGEGDIGRPDAPAPEPIRFLPTFAPPPEQTYALSGSERAYTRRDLQYLIHHVYSTPLWAGRDLKGLTLPSGAVLADYQADVAPFLELLERHRLLIGRGPRVRGNLVGEEGGALAALHLL